MSPTVLRHNPADNAAAVALLVRAAADAAAAAANCDGPSAGPESSALCCAAATTADALASTAPQDTPSVHWLWHTDEEEGRPRLGGRIPEPGPAEPGGPCAASVTVQACTGAPAPRATGPARPGPPGLSLITGGKSQRARFVEAD